jgi:hypothetical protein
LRERAADFVFAPAVVETVVETVVQAVVQVVA